ncbi:MAG: T9SS type A sorting domain-containing protein [Prolixibacteraceae bacterium]|nr:T9SS type A sorting domain-containing protein [Prolixibacteraceae bacterium]
MKRVFHVILSAMLVTALALILFFPGKEKAVKLVDKKHRTPAEMKAQTIEFKKKRRMNGWAKPDQPSEFIHRYNRIRTKAGNEKPAYELNYKMQELQKAQTRNAQLKSQTVELDWKERGPGNVSGRTRGLIIDPDDPNRNTWFVGSVGGGVWKTNDAGKSWINLTNDFPTLSTVCLAMAASNSKVIYAGTGEGFYNGDAIVGDGIFKSIDKGNSWIQLPATAANKDFAYVNRLVVDPANENIVLAVTNTSIQKSTNGGASWQKVFDDFRRIQHIVVHPQNFNIQYATANTKGVLKSTDAGNTWNYILEEASGRIELAIAPSKPETVYALTESSQLYLSENSGQSWAPAKITSGVRDLFLSSQGWYDNAIAVSPDDPNLIMIGGVNVYKVEIIGTSSAPTSFVSVSAIGTDAFMSYVNHGGDYLGGGMEVNLAKNNYQTIEVQFGPGKKQKAHRFKVPDGATSGVAANNHTYLDYVDVPFEVWDLENNRQLMVSFRDQDQNGKFNLTIQDDAALIGREYIWINDVTYQNNPSPLIAVTGGFEFEEIAFWWPILSDGAVWNENNLPASKIVIHRKDVFVKELKSTKVADWAAQGAPYVHADLHNIQFTKTANGTTRIVVANDGGLGYSDNLGLTWTNPTNGYNTTQFYGVDKHPAQDRYIGGLQDNGTWFSGENPGTLSQWTEATGGDGFDAVWHATDPSKLISTIYYNSIYRSNDGGESWGYSAGFDDEGSGKAPFITQIGYTGIDPDKLYLVGKSGVTISKDFGQTWELTAIPDSLWGWAGDGYVEPSPANPMVVWAAAQMSDHGHVMVSQNGGKHFLPTNNFKEEMGVLSGLATHPLNDSIAYALFSYAGYAKILKTENLGQSWEDISGFVDGESTRGFPDVAVYSLLVMPHQPTEIWAGTEIGIFRSTNGGESWAYANNGLPAVSIWEMKIRGNQLFVATHGRGIWSVDLPELNTVLKAPVLLAAGTSPSKQTLAQVQWGSNYDSVTILLDGQYSQTVTGNFPTQAPSTQQLGEALEEGIHQVQMIAYSKAYVLKSIEKSFMVVDYHSPEYSYINAFDQWSDDFTGNGFNIIEFGALGDGLGIHTTHPYPDNANISFYLKKPIIIDNANNSKKLNLTYRDIPCVEEGESGSVYGSANFYDYVIAEASTNGIDWKPLLNGYDFRQIRVKATALGKTIDDRPTASMFLNHEIDLTKHFTNGDTIALRFRLFSDSNTNGWGWVIDDVAITPTEKVGTADLSDGGLSMYPVPCNQALNIVLPIDYQQKAQIILYDINGRKVLEHRNSNEALVTVNTSGLSSGVYLVEIKSGKQLLRKRIEVKR